MDGIKEENTANDDASSYSTPTNINSVPLTSVSDLQSLIHKCSINKSYFF